MLPENTNTNSAAAEADVEHSAAPYIPAIHNVVAQRGALVASARAYIADGYQEGAAVGHLVRLMRGSPLTDGAAEVFRQVYADRTYCVVPFHHGTAVAVYVAPLDYDDEVFDTLQGACDWARESTPNRGHWWDMSDHVWANRYDDPDYAPCGECLGDVCEAEPHS